MARRSFRSRAVRGSGTQRKWVWAGFLEDAFTVAASGAEFRDLLSDFETDYGADLLGCTVMRIRGEVKIDQSATWGARVFTQSTLALLTASQAAPTDDDWFWLQPMYLDETTGVRVASVDVKSSRKLEELGQGLLLSVFNHSGSILTASINVRVGLKLP